MYPHPKGSITEKRFLKFSLFLPLIVPTLLGMGIYVASTFVSTSLYDLGLSPIVFFTAFVLVYSGVLGGIPYIIFLIGWFVWMRDKCSEQILRSTWLAPIIYLAIFTVCILVLTVVQLLKSPTATLESTSFSIISLCFVSILVIGYGYVFLVNFTFRIRFSGSEARGAVKLP